ncbi:MAG: methionine--tRNA ligase [Bacillota bacterium]|nr:methionine--tRNA ligase [Bacillota bacterium]
MKIFIGGAWPYANGSLHLGQIAAVLPGDILARYFRLKGADVLYVSGSDCHGTPISIRAVKENTTPKSITDRYHNEFKQCFEKLGFSYDLYYRTDHDFHKSEVQDVFLELYEKGYIYKKVIEQTFCTQCNQFLPDRYVNGICPNCGNTARGDQCDFCSSLLEPLELKDRTCGICGNTPVTKETEHLFFALSKLQGFIEDFVKSSEGWRLNAIKQSNRYLDEGLVDRSVTRDLPWGIEVPVRGFEDKKIYVWIDAILGYLTASKLHCNFKNSRWEDFWDGDVRSYYVHGKDNIPFHSIILPAILYAIGLKPPDRIISSEYLTIEGKKLSTSNNWAVWVPDVIERYNPDSLRYFLIANGPEKRDTDFSWREFVNSHNGELLGAFGNLVNRTVVFANKYFGQKVPEGEYSLQVKEDIYNLYETTGKKIENGEFKAAIEEIFSFIRGANKYYDEEKPWITLKTEPYKCQSTIYTCIQIIANLSNLLSPFIPFSCAKLRKMLNVSAAAWKSIIVSPNTELNESELLFERIDKSVVEEEMAKLGR